MEQLSHEYKGADYAGLVMNLSGNLEVHSHPMVVYCGLLYHGQTIVDPEKRDKWAKFNVEVVGEHVLGIIEQTECKSVSARLSMPTAQFIAKLVQHLAAPLIDSQIKDSRTFPEEIFAVCHLQGIEGPWADDFFQRAYGADLERAPELRIFREAD
ncbi:Uncharacterized protein FKW44_017558 [Caligus rogercresseyi]|uniref:Uncharacterized protein n=1 Tax=Caligus rogercresseyi TaxID=217165 RepID=A0A7T8GTB2_CALRO|nr:Uncharacterized protein FKW44_017558 [Caligus rogercresseyi]